MLSSGAAFVPGQLRMAARFPGGFSFDKWDVERNFRYQAITLIEVFRLPGLAVVLIPWVLSGLWAYAEQVIDERLNFLADCMASCYMRPDIEAKHHHEESPNCPFHDGNPITGRTATDD